jgi:hypothetical protein
MHAGREQWNRNEVPGKEEWKAKTMISGAGLRIRITLCEELYNERNNAILQL